MKNFEFSFLREVSNISTKIDLATIKNSVKLIKRIKNINGRIFILGVGGSAGNASHAVNDFRKLCNIESYAPTDNISELTARTNDEGWENVFCDWLKCSRINGKDLVLIFSVGGGNKRKNISINLINAVKFAKKRNAKVISIVGKKNGYCYKNSDESIYIPEVNKNFITPLSESYQAVLWHLFVSHPELKEKKTVW